MTVMRSQTRAEALNRLRYIEGHLAAVRRMVEAERYCVDVLEQSHAVDTIPFQDLPESARRKPPLDKTVQDTHGDLMAAPPGVPLLACLSWHESVAEHGRCSTSR